MLRLSGVVSGGDGGSGVVYRDEAKLMTAKATGHEQATALGQNGFPLFFFVHDLFSLSASRFARLSSRAVSDRLKAS